LRQDMSLKKPALAINAGSSSLKISLFSPNEAPRSLLIERIGEPAATLLDDSSPCASRAIRADDHRQALAEALAFWRAARILDTPEHLAVIGHRVVHGGERFTGPTRLTRAVIEEIEQLSSLAPLHNPIALQGIRAMLELAPTVPQVALFDTAFHHSLPPEVYHYALPRRFYDEHHIRRYGFHGLSVAAVSREAARLLDRPASQLNLIVAHLGNGASMTAVRGGNSVETSMGFTPLEGLVMGSRAGDLDPAIPEFIERQAGLTPEQVDALLNHDSGLKGLCGDSDLRAIYQRIEQGDPDAKLAHEVYVHRIRKYLGAYTAVLGRVDALIFTAGVGEHGARTREAVCANLDRLGYVLCPTKNRRHQSGAVAIHAADSQSEVWVIPTDEAQEIARQAIDLIRNEGDNT